MALTIAIEGTGIVANCDATASTDSAGGAWSESGGTSLVYDPATFIYGVRSMGIKAASKSGWTYINKTTALNFSSGGSQEGELLYIWINASAPAAFVDIASNGISIRCGSSTTVYREWTIGGGGVDEMNGWTGAWKCFVLDPTTAGSNDNGTYDDSNVDLIGVWVDTDVSVRAETIFIDQIACGKGLRITGTWDDTTYPDGAWDEVLAYCTTYASRAWGMVQEREGIFYVYGKIWIGDSTQSAITSFEDSGRTIQFGTSQYYNASAQWVSTFPTDGAGIIIEDHASYTTKFVDGVIVGTENGRSGSVYIGNDDQNVIMDLYGGNNAASETLCYGTSFKVIKGAFNSGNDAGHKFLGCSFAKCSQFDPVGAPVIRNCTFAETVDIDAALLWNANIDIEDCSFIANTIGAAIEMANQGTFTYTGLSFSGNTYDILYSDDASSGLLTINASGSDPTTYEITNSTGNTVSILNSKNFKFTLNPSLTGYEWRIYEVTALGSLAGATEKDGEETATADNQTYSYNYSSDQPIAVQIINQPNNDYVETTTYYILGNADQDIQILLTKDINN